MNMLQGWKKPLAVGVVIAALALVWGLGPGWAQTTTRDKEVDIAELKRMVEVAKESGFNTEEIQKITIEDDGQLSKMARDFGFSKEEMGRIIVPGELGLVVVWEFLHVLEQKKKAEAARIKYLREKKYLTVQDLFSDLRKERPDDLDSLRKEPEYNK